jgi:hypothetical protein
MRPTPISLSAGKGVSRAQVQCLPLLGAHVQSYALPVCTAYRHFCGIAMWQLPRILSHTILYWHTPTQCAWSTSTPIGLWIPRYHIERIADVHLTAYLGLGKALRCFIALGCRPMARASTPCCMATLWLRADARVC